MSMDELSLGLDHTQGSRSMSFSDQELTQMAKEILHDLHETDPMHQLWGNPLRITKLPSFHSFALSPTVQSPAQSPKSHHKTASTSFNSELIHNLKCETHSSPSSIPNIIDSTPHETHDSWHLVIPDIPIISTSKSAPVSKAPLAPRPSQKSTRNKVCQIPDFMDKEDVMQKTISPNNDKQLHAKSHNDLHSYNRRSAPAPKRPKRRPAPPPMTKRHRQSVPANSSQIKNELMELKLRQKRQSLPSAGGATYKPLKNRYNRDLPHISLPNKDLPPASQSHSDLRANGYRQLYMETHIKRARSVPPCNSPLVEEYLVENDNDEFVFVSSM
eukprot:330065_1